MKIFDDFLSQFHDFLPIAIKRFSDNNQLQEALLYAMTNGGKRIRPLLCFIFARMQTHHVLMRDIIYVATALECIHCYSLVHDDLPAMDNDALRRGLPTVHKKYTEATAILVGDALQTMAFSLLTDARLECVAEVKIKLIQTLSHASGAKGMVNGQFLDMNLDTHFDKHNLSHITTMHQQKTGALITASCIMGAILANHQNSDSIKNAQIIGELIGTLFQIQDDILDITQSTHTLGKTAGKDLTDNKPTITALMGLENAQIYADTITQNLHNTILTLSDNRKMLEIFIQTLIKRQS